MIFKISYRLHRQLASNDFALYKIKYEGSSRFYWSNEKSDWIGPYKEFEYWQPTPVLVIEGESLTEIAGEFTSLGFTPSDLSVKTGELAATKIHLEDMRRLVFEKKP